MEKDSVRVSNQKNVEEPLVWPKRSQRKSWVSVSYLAWKIIIVECIKAKTSQGTIAILWGWMWYQVAQKMRPLQISIHCFREVYRSFLLSTLPIEKYAAEASKLKAVISSLSKNISNLQSLKSSEQPRSESLLADNTPKLLPSDPRLWSHLCLKYVHLQP